MPATQQDLFSSSVGQSYPPGFRYVEEAISASDEKALIARISELPFKEFQFRGFEGKRRVVSFGWRYDYNEHKAIRSEPVPDFLLDAYTKIQRASQFRLPEMQQALVTEYSAGAPIGWHRDRPVFGEVMGLSLLSRCTLRLRKRLGDKWERVSVELHPRSSYFFEGAARWEWEHSIPPVEELRYSITFRNLRAKSESLS